MRSGGPPRWTEALLAAALPARDRDPILGDLAEEYEVRARDNGTKPARWWYRRQVVRALGPALARRFMDDKGRTTMGTSGVVDAVRELHTSMRSLIRTPRFTALAVLTLALGIGASTAIWAVVESVVLSPLAYPDADRLVRLDHPVPGQGPGERWELSVAGYFHFRNGMTTLSDLGAVVANTRTLTGDGPPERIPAAAATASLLQVLGARPALGRLFTEEEDEPGAPAAALLSHGLWQRRFGGDPSVVGRTVELDGEAVPVVGVLEADFDLPESEVALWTPLRLDPTAPAVNSHYVRAIGRLADGATPAAALTEMRRLTGRLPRLFPDAYTSTFMEETRFAADVRPLRETVIQGVDRTLWMILAGVGLVLLVALANVSNLFLVRTEGRVREVGVRTALGADRASLARHFMGEGLLLSTAAGILGIGLAVAGVDALVALAPPDLPRLDEVSVGGSTLVVASVVAVLCGLVVGAFPLWRTAGIDPSEALGDTGGRGGTASRRAGTTRDGLVAVQVALALVLLTGSGLMFRSFQRLASEELGFEPAEVTVFHVSLPDASYPDADAVYRFHREFLDRLEEAPGIVSAGAGNGVPLAGGGYCVSVQFEDTRTGEAFNQGCPEVRFVSPGYFETLGIEVAAGRAFRHEDNEARTASLVVSRGIAERIWEGEDPLGRGARLWGPTFYRVVGVVEDVRVAGPASPPEPVMYYPLRPAPDERMPSVGSLTYVVKGADGTPAAETIREVMRSLDPDLPVGSLRSMEEIVAGSMVRTTFTLLLLGIAGGLALLLGVVGMYGVVAYTVSRRTRELGIRMSLGADGQAIRWMVLRHATALALVGVGVGLVAAWIGSGLVRSLLYDVSPTDPLTFAATALGLVGVSLLAAWVPAHRATRIDPADALRSD